MGEQLTLRDMQRSKSRSERLIRVTLWTVGMLFLAGSLYSLTLYVLSNIAGLATVVNVSWEQTVSGNAWSFQREYVTYTDTKCILLPIVDEGERVSKGLEIARLNFMGEIKLNEPSNRRLYSQVAGIVSYEPDGLELISELKDYQALTIMDLDKIIGPAETAQKSSQGLAGLIQDKVQAESRGASGDTTASGSILGDGGGGGTSAGGGQTGEQREAAAPMTYTREIPSNASVVKVTDNLSDCYIYIRLPEQEEAPFAPGDRVSMRLEGSGEGRGSTLQCEEIAGGWGLLLKLETGLEALRHSRKHQLTIMLGTEDRCAVPSGTVVMKGGEIGVYTAEKNRARWMPVVVVEERDGLQIIEGIEPNEILPGDLIVTRPWLIWDGMKLQG